MEYSELHAVSLCLACICFHVLCVCFGMCYVIAVQTGSLRFAGLASLALRPYSARQGPKCTMYIVGGGDTPPKREGMFRQFRIINQSVCESISFAVPSILFKKARPHTLGPRL